MKNFETITVPVMQTLMAESSFTLLDCRDMKDYRVGHIDNAMCLHEGLKDSILKKGDQGVKIIIYCYYGHASEHLAETFADFGFQQVYSLQGGYASWKENLEV